MFEDDIPDAETPPGFDADEVIRRWKEIAQEGALGDGGAT